MENSELKSKLLDISPVGMLMLDTGGNILYINKEAEKILGLPANDIKKLSFDAVNWKITNLKGQSIHSEDLPFSQVVKTKKPIYNFEHAIESKLGEKIYLSINASPVFDDAGQLESVITSIQDISQRITAQKKKEETEKRYRNLFDNLIDEVHSWKVIRDSAGQIIDWQLIEANAATLRNWNKQFSEVIGRTSSDLFGQEALELFMPIVKKIFKTGKAERWEVYFPPTKQYLAMDSIPFDEYFISTGRDISDSKKLKTELISAKENAEKSEDRYKGLLSNLETGIVVHDQNTSITMCNQRSTELLGLSMEQMRGKDAKDPFWRFVYDDGTKIPLEDYPVMRVLKTGKPLKDQTFGVYRSKNDLVWLQVNGIPIKNSKGEFSEIIISFIDVTERKLAQENVRKAKEEAEESERKLIEAQALSHVGSWEFMFETDTVTWSKELFNIFGRPSHLGAPSYSKQRPFYTAESFEIMDRAVEDCIQRQIPYEIELEIITGTGDKKIIISKADVIKDKEGKVIGCFGTAQDITERKKLENNLIEAKLKAEESDQLKSVFLSNMSHEIRTPLNAIIGFSQIIAREIKDPEHIKYVEHIKSAGEYLLRLISDILLYSHIEANQLKLNPGVCSVNDLIKEMYEQFIIHIEGKDIELSYDLGLTDTESIIISDGDRIKAVIINLLNNAIKHSSGSKIKFGYIKVKNDLEFYVQDNGVGISENNQELIFKRFHQITEGKGRSGGGTGLGLAISKGMTEILGGTIRIESELNHGAKFIFTIPYEKSILSQKSLIAEPHPSQQDKNYRILIVEDSELNMKLLCTIMEKFEHSYSKAFNGLEAIEILQNDQNFDIILMDIQMSEMNGYEALIEIRKMGIKIPVIAQTAFSSEDTIKRIRDLGFNDLIMKPIDINELFKLIKRNVRSRRLNIS